MKIFVVVLVLVVLYAATCFGIMYFRYKKGAALATSAKKYERSVPDSKLHFLFLGDSTAVGVGASDASKSLAGLFAKDFPDASIENRGVSGMRVHGLLESFVPSEGERYDLVVINIGGNDIVHFTDAEGYSPEIKEIFERARKISDNVFVLHGGDITHVPFYPWPFGLAYLGRTEKLRDIFMQAAAATGVHYVDIYTAEKTDPRSEVRSLWFAADAFHPNDTSYQFWYEQVRREMNRAGSLK